MLSTILRIIIVGLALVIGVLATLAVLDVISWRDFWDGGVRIAALSAIALAVALLINALNASSRKR